MIYFNEQNNFSGDRFRVYNYNLTYGQNQHAIKKFIVLAGEEGTITFTDFSKYANNPNRKIHSFEDNGNNRMVLICSFLNYAFFLKKIRRLSELTVDIGKNYLNDYGMHSLPNDTEFTHRSKATVERTAQVILDFYINLINDKNSGCQINKEDLFMTKISRNRYGAVYEKKVPVFQVNYIPRERAEILRDIPNDAFDLLFQHVFNNHKELLGIVSISAFGGLRPSAACNVRRMDSPLGPGIRIEKSNGELVRAKIDLKHKYNLRSDLKNVGGIKRKREVDIPDIFLDAFDKSLEEYKKYLDGVPFEKDFGAFSINRQGKALTYPAYLYRFKKLIEEMIPIYEKSGNPELVLYAKTLREHPISPHIFRHWFTVQLVLHGIENPALLMYFRGDRSPESANTYIQAKGELEKQYAKTNNEAFDYLIWLGKNKYATGI